MPITLAQRPTISVGDVDLVGINYTDWLDGAETLTGTPTVTEITTSALTFANIAVSTTALTILGETVAIGCAVVFKVSGQAQYTTYRVRVSVGTTGGTVARTKIVDILLECV